MADLTIPYGLTAENRMVNAMVVPRGAACGCRCPACQRPLIAHQGESDRAWHFQHEPDASGAATVCVNAYETSIHLKAKDIILAHTSLTIPALVARYQQQTKQLHPERQQSYLPRDKEVWLGDISRRPDVMVEVEGAPFAVEVFYRHACPPEKIADFATRDLTSIEIDLSLYAPLIVADEAALTRVVLGSAKRRWLFHSRQAEIDRDFAAECIEQERLAAEREAARQAVLAEQARQRAEEAAKAQAAERERQAQLSAEMAAKEAEDRRRWSEQAAIDRAQRVVEAEERRRLEALSAAEREAAVIAASLARHDADGTSQRCMICQQPNSPFGFGLPPAPTLWACMGHRATVEGLWTPGPYVPCPGPAGPPGCLPAPRRRRCGSSPGDDRARLCPKFNSGHGNLPVRACVARAQHHAGAPQQDRPDLDPLPDLPRRPPAGATRNA